MNMIGRMVGSDNSRKWYGVQKSTLEYGKGLTGSFENIVKNATMNLQWFTFVSLYGVFFPPNCPKQPGGRNEEGKSW